MSTATETLGSWAALEVVEGRRGRAAVGLPDFVLGDLPTIFVALARTKLPRPMRPGS